MEVAEAAVAALGDHDALARLGHVGEHRAALLVEDLRPDRHFQDRVGAAPAGAIAAHPVHAGLGLEMLLVAKVDERVEAVRAFDHDVAAAPAVAAVGAAELDEFLAPERDRARPAVAGANVDARLVEKLHRRAASHGARASSSRRGCLEPRRVDACPIRAGEAEAVAFDQAPARRRALQARAEQRKTALSEHGLRGLVLDPDAGQDLDRPASA